MQVEIPQELADTIASRFAGVSVEDYVVRTVREAIDELPSNGTPWWAGDLSGLAEGEDSDVSVWQNAQVGAWSRAA